MAADNDNLVREKVCTRCKETKPLTEFFKSGKYIRPECKVCSKAYTADYVARNKERLNAASREWHKKNPERSKEIRAAWVESNRDYMREKARERSVIYRANNEAAIKEKKRKEYLANKEKVNAKSKAWKLNNPEKAKIHTRTATEKRNKDPKKRLNHSISSNVRRGLLRGSKDGRKAYDLIGYSAEQLRAHLEKQFRDGMTWDNCGEWHIDHIIPLSAFNYETPDDIDFKRAWALSNLQPLWKEENLKKRAKLTKPFQPSLLLATNDNIEPRPQKETTT